MGKKASHPSPCEEQGVHCVGPWALGMIQHYLNSARSKLAFFFFSGPLLSRLALAAMEMHWQQFFVGHQKRPLFSLERTPEGPLTRTCFDCQSSEHENSHNTGWKDIKWPSHLRVLRIEASLYIWLDFLYCFLYTVLA